MTTDPGSVPKDALPLNSDVEERDFEANEKDRFKKFCRRCNAFKPIRAHHCSICGRCIVKMDHHCP
jgi:ribosomal protein L40E